MPEYVIAEFNEDFTKVRIYKNGEDSDGKMMNWDEYTDDSYDEYVNSYCSPMVKHHDTLKEVIVEEGCFNIGSNAFGNCEKIKKVTLPESLNTLGVCCVKGCRNLQQINIPSNLKVVRSSAFSHCTSLIEMVLPDTVTTLNGTVFYGCKNL